MAVRADSCCQVIGLRGPSGYLGNQGSQGYQGVSGLDGLDGLGGLQGSRGLQGGVGVDVVGGPGSPGPFGYSGNIGVSGQQGPDGGIGPKGLRGAFGAYGLTGAQGYQGADAFSGQMGSDGEMGAQGLLGAQGIQGAGQPFSFKAAVDNSGSFVTVSDGSKIRLTSLSGVLFNLVSGSALVEISMGNLLQGNGSPVSSIPVPYNGARSAIYFENVSGAMWMWDPISSGWVKQTLADGFIGPQGIDGKNGLPGDSGNRGFQGQSVIGLQGPIGPDVIGNTGYDGFGLKGYQGDLTIGTMGPQGPNVLTGVYHSPYVIHTISNGDPTTRNLPIDLLVPNAIIEIKNNGGDIFLPPSYQILSFLSLGIGMLWTVQCQLAYTVIADSNIFFSANSGIGATTFPVSTNFPVSGRTTFLFMNYNNQLYATDLENAPFGSRFREPLVKGVYP